MLVVITLALTACAPDPVVTTPPAEPQTPSASPTPEPVAVRPDTGFPLACGEIDRPPLAAALGAPLALEGSPYNAFDDAVVVQRGFESCKWGPDSGPYAIATLGTHLRGDEELGTPDGPLGGTSSRAGCNEYRCWATALVDGMWLVASLQGEGGGSAVSAAWTAAWRDAVQALADRGRPMDWAPPPGAGPAIFDCELLASLDVAGAVGADAAMTLRDSTTFDEGSAVQLPRDWPGFGGTSECQWYGEPNRLVTARLLSGGAWLVDEPDFDLEPADIAGADEAYRICESPRPCSFVVVVGIDAIHVSVGSSYAATEMTEADARAAAELIVPAVAAN
jgi:hypothetical protein